MLCREQGRWAEAETALLELIQRKGHANLTGLDAGLPGYKARHVLGEVYRAQGRETEAETQWRRVVAERPDYAVAWQDLGEQFLRQGRWQEFDEVIVQLGKIPHAAAEAAQLQARGRDSRTLPAALPPAQGPGALGIVWEGSQETAHSFDRVNRELCRRLRERGCDLLPHPSVTRPVTAHVRHQWPPDFTPPPASHWVMIQPWEYGSLPKAWIKPLTQQVDEVWAYSRFVRDCYLQSGVPADRLHVVPLGVDPARYHPEVKPLALETDKRFKFLFVGGTIFRKGIDVLLEAYAQAFRAADDVCLVIKDLGNGSFYKGQTAEERIAQYRSRPDAPAIEYLHRYLSEDELAGLYAACACLVQPYRGEGFALPVAEAMACGLPVLVPRHGPVLDYCGAEHAYFVPARITRFRQQRVGRLETVDYPWLAEPDRQAVRDGLIHVATHPDEARAKGRAAAVHIHQHFTWDHAAAAVEARLEALRHQPMRRLQPLRKVMAGVAVAG